MPVPAVNYTLLQTRSIMTATPAPVVAAVPVVEYVQLAPTFQIAAAAMTVIGVDMNRDGIPDVSVLVRIRRRPLEQGFPVIAEESQRFVRNWFCADFTWCC